ncbi:uncharacterized protein LOC135693678 isoform X2 [Rhopilema esculentum]|uniref:uncharacterized protein LOC135693678 isoform X2 n=1 Tax=Rhopilema esculentum TaxID=499914 RepID=UPI0031CF542E
MAVDRNRAENMRLLHDTLIYNLTEIERRQFTVILSNFQTRRDREKFVISLRRLLNTPKKQEVVPYLLVILPSREREHFLNLWMRTSQYNHFYSLEENKNGRYSRKQNLTYNNSYQNHQRQEQLYQKRKLHSTAQSWKSNKRPPLYSRPNSALSSNRLSASLPSLRIPSQPGKQPKTHLISMKRSSKGDGFGFSIRGGAEHGLGIYVSNVEQGSIAEKKNLCTGDQIVKINEFNFQKIDHANAVKIIQQNKKLRLLVFSSSLVPGARLSHMEYQWVDTNGRPSSPPLNFREKSSQISRSRSIGDIRLLQDDEERRVIVHVQSGTRLGLKIRGGMEYGLGIYVSAVDRNHMAEKSGIRAGDQIIDVNGLDFLEISHKDAVRVLKSYKMMSMILRHIGKIPYAKTLFERTEWLDSARTSRSSSIVSIAHDGRTSPSPERSKFRQGIAGSQLLHQSAVVVPAHRRIEEQARSVLNEKELASLKYYISEYIQGSIHVEGLVISLFHLFDSSKKISLLNDVRSVIFPQDLDVFDRLVLEKEIEARNSLNQVSPRKDQQLNGNHLGNSRLSPKVPAKALSYKQLKSPRRQTNSKVPWSPPSTPQPAIPSAEHASPIAKVEQVLVHHQSPVIDDLDFEEDEDEDEDEGPEYAAISQVKVPVKEVVKVPAQEVVKEPTQEVPQRLSSPESKEELLRRIIEEGMKKLNASDGHQENGGNMQGDTSPSNDVMESPVVSVTGSPCQRPSAHGNETEDEDIGLSLMRSALFDFGKAVHSEDELDNEDDKHSVKGNFAGQDPKEEEILQEAQTEHAPFGLLGGAMFRPTIVPEEDLTVVRETAVGSAPMSPSRWDTNLEYVAKKTVGYELDTESVADKVINSSANSFPVVEEKASVMESYMSNDGGIIDLSRLSLRSRVNVNNNMSGNFSTDDSDDDTLRGIEPIQDDLEFEFEDEPELAEPDMQEIDNDSTTLKFAPIKLQETAPSTPSVDANQNPQDKEEQYGRADRGRLFNVYEANPTFPRPFGHSHSTGNNRRQRFEVKDVSDSEIDTGAGFQNFSPRILSGSKIVTGDAPTFGFQADNSSKDSHTSTDKENKVNLSSDDRAMDDRTTNGISDSILVLPDRNLTAKRIPIVTYRAGSPDKGFRDGNAIVRDIEEMAAANRKKQGDDGNAERSAFRNLRSIFEHQRQGTPKTEYLSEIIKKNNSEGRRRIRSTDSVDEAEEEAASYVTAINGMETGNKHGRHGKQNFSISSRYPVNLGESDLSSTDDFDFSSIRYKPKFNSSLNSPTSDDKTEISSGYGSEDYSPVSEAHQKVVKIEKGREELGLVLEASKRQKRGVQIKSIMTGESYAACMYPQLEVGQEVVSVDGEPLQGLGAQIATISMKRAYNNPSGRFLEIVVRNQRS